MDSTGFVSLGAFPMAGEYLWCILRRHVQHNCCFVCAHSDLILRKECLPQTTDDEDHDRKIDKENIILEIVMYVNVFENNT